MNNEQFTKDALRTESPNYFQQDPRVLHAAFGLVTEAGELLDALKKATFYGKPLDVTNIKEEAGDILWYLAILFDAINTDFSTEQARVIAKLRARFPEKFTENDAFDRDLITERKILEQE
jgi:NTP pyrophosphatase (non-canonical NTP hydrolase)